MPYALWPYRAWQGEQYLEVEWTVGPIPVDDGLGALTACTTSATAEMPDICTARVLHRSCSQSVPVFQQCYNKQAQGLPSVHSTGIGFDVSGRQGSGHPLR